MLKVGIIGNGSISGAHRSAYKRLFESGEAEVVAICDIRPERLEEEFRSGFDDARLYTDVDEMLRAEAGKLDYVDICVPTFLHAEISIKAMQAGFNVLCEKPMARTVAQAEEMVKVSKETGKTLMIAYCNRFNEGAMEVKKVIDSKKYGRVISADFRREGGSDDSGGWNNWFADFELSGSAALDFQIHDIDMIRWMFGMPNAVSMVGGNFKTKGGGYDIMSTNFMFDDNMFVNSTCNWYVGNNFFNTRVIRVNFEHGYVYLERTGGRETFVEVPRHGEAIDLSEKNVFDPYFEEIKYFVGVIRDGKQVDYNVPEESVDSIKLVMAELESADKNGERIAL